VFVAFLGMGKLLGSKTRLMCEVKSVRLEN
jgi:hypothetical protein